MNTLGPNDAPLIRAFYFLFHTKTIYIMKKKKLNLLYLVAPIAAIILSYLLVAFCVWDANPSNWGLGGRYAACMIWVFLTPIALINIGDDTF